MKNTKKNTVLNIVADSIVDILDSAAVRLAIGFLALGLVPALILTFVKVSLAAHSGQ